ncbi:hypothetical protein MKEN_01300500 [Mycena kentingensis (nom. inval.)]|nr:hypothetical protein MKEN_01300500 [Mycena kentingensis (nom. inval.)]
MASPLYTTSALALCGITAVGGFSRLTSGAYTPGYYAYQTARAPNDNLILPIIDFTLLALLVYKNTRKYAAGVLGVMCGVGSYIAGSILRRMWGCSRRLYSRLPRIGRYIGPSVL